MINGVFRFIFVRIPDWIYNLSKDLFDWLGRFLRYAIRFYIRLARALFFASIWALLVFGPFATTLLVPDLRGITFRAFGISWASIGFIGSIWGLYRWQHKHRRPQPSRRPNGHAWMFGCLSIMLLAGLLAGASYLGYVVFYRR
jgi:hypothetical protein